MNRIPPETMHVRDAGTNVELCHARAPRTLTWLRRELGLTLAVETEWQRRRRRLAMRFKQTEAPDFPSPPPFMTVRETSRK